MWSEVKDPTFVEKAKQLVRVGKETTSLCYKPDIVTNPRRLTYLIVHMHRYYKKYKTYCK